MNYVDYSRKSFTEFHNTLPQGFVRFKNEEDRKIYVSRLGVLFSWQHKDGVVVSTETLFPVPGALTHADFDWLRDTARNIYHWRGGVKKLNYYETLTADELNKQGIDPFFYAWMFVHKYKPTDGVESGWPYKVLTEEEYKDLHDSVSERTEEEQNELFANLIAFKCKGGSYVVWCKVQGVKSRKQELKERIEALVDEFSAPDGEVSNSAKESAKSQIFTLIEKLM